MRRNKLVIRFKLEESFFTIVNPTTGQYKEKGSKFIAFAHPVTDFEQIKGILESLRKEYYDARHHCYAWILGASKEQFKAVDDGEPNHSAGDPILNQIKSKNLTNVLVVVVRYFGGVKLGVGGLTSAYKIAAQEALNLATLKQIFISEPVRISFSYENTSLVKNLIQEFALEVVHEKYDEACEMELNIRIAKVEAFQNRIKTLNAQGYSIKLIIKQ